MEDDIELSIYGAPVMKRKIEISEKIKNPKSTFPIEFQGKYQNIPVITVKIGFPVYRLENGRTKTLQKEYLAKHDVPSDLFQKDHDSLAAQTAQNEILSSLIDEAGLKDHFKKGNDQQLEPIVCTNEGVVVNGNRRLCTWRSLYLENPQRYKYFQNIDIAILPPCDDEDVRDLERRLQIQNTMKAKYKWHTLALMFSEELHRKVSPKPTATSVGAIFDRSPQEVNTLIDARDYAEKYLESRDKADYWSEVDDKEWAFRQMANYKKRFSKIEDKVLFEKICFTLIDESVDGDRLYKQIKDVGANFDSIAERLSKELKVEEKEPVTPDLVLLGGGEPGITTRKASRNAVAVAVDGSDKKQTIKVIQSEIEVQKQLKDDKDSQEFLLNQIKKAADSLNYAVTSGLKPESSKTGVSEQLDSIAKNIEKIKKWLDEH